VTGGPSRVRRAYRQQRARAGGVWHSYVAAAGSTGALVPIIEDDADHVTHGYSVQKLAVATAVMDKVDRGELRLDRRLDLPADIILGGGIYHLQTVWGDNLTIANVLTALLLVSDNTAVRMCGRVVPGPEINEILAAKGFVHTRVQPLPADPSRFFLGLTTPREMTDLVWRLANRTLLSARSSDFLLRIIGSVNGYHDGIRRTMSSSERSRVATKHGADFDELGATRNEAGVIVDAGGAPALVYGFFADSLGELDNYGATHPAVQAHAALGRAMLDAVDRQAASFGTSATQSSSTGTSRNPPGHA
jgi:beta-lactamase class A